MFDALRHGTDPRSEAARRSEGASGAVLAVGALLLLAAAGALSIGGLDILQVSRIATVLLAAVLVVTVAFGLTLGLVSAAIALAIYDLLMGEHFLRHGLWSREGLVLSLFTAGLICAGLRTDIRRRNGLLARVLMGAGRALSTHAPAVAAGELLSHAPPADPGAQATIAQQAGRVAVSLSVSAVGWASVQVLGEALGPMASMLLLLAAVLVVAAVVGAEFGGVSGLLAVLAVSTFPTSSSAVLFHRPSDLMFAFAAFVVFGWGVGKLGEALQGERRARGLFISASRNLSVGVDEAAIRRSLLESLVSIAPRAMVQVGDETGELRFSSSDSLPWPEASSPEAQGARSSWRLRRLVSDGRDVGFVRWSTFRAGGEKAFDDIASALIDLAASAIVRSRLNIEKSEMEFVARTEHLRTILLDAVSHHFRSPLAGILGSVTSILSLPEQHDRAARREFLLIIKEQANRLNRYVENFLSVARLESGSIDVNLAEVSVEALIYDVWETFGEAGGARRFLHVKLTEDQVRSDASLLKQIFGNVLENAIKYSAEGSVVDVRSRRDAGRLVFEVTDQGPGVPAASRERIFERFFRSPSAKAPGLGLGLYITRSLVQLLGGDVQAHDRSDGESGLRVAISLPAAEGEQ